MPHQGFAESQNWTDSAVTIEKTQTNERMNEQTNKQNKRLIIWGGLEPYFRYRVRTADDVNICHESFSSLSQYNRGVGS